MKSTVLTGRRQLVMVVGVALLMVAASTVVQAQTSSPGFSKSFVPDTIGPGSVSTLVFDISNLQSGTPATDLAFTDVLPAGITLAAPAIVSNSCGGTLTAPDGGGTITLADGSVGAGLSCKVVVNVTATAPGEGPYTNISGDLTSNAGNSGSASADLVVSGNRPGFSKAFSPASVPLGHRSTLTFTIDNTANQSALQSFSFVDNLPTGMVVAAPAAATTDCGTTQVPPTLTAGPGTGLISLTANGALPSFPALAAGATCSVTVDVVAGAVGVLGNTSEELLVNFSDSSGRASATLTVAANQIGLIKSFTDDPVPAGDTVTLQFTVANFDRFNAASAISFTDDLGATLSGLTAVGLPMSNVCGAGSQLTGTTLLTLTGGSLGAEAQCAFSVTLQVPAGVATGAYPNVTSALIANVGGSPVTGPPAADVLFVSPAPHLTKEFTDDPVGAGGSVTLEFTVTNTSASESATGITFIDELTTFLGSPLSVSLPSTPCGAGSTVSVTTLPTLGQGLLLSGGSLAPGGSCTFDVTIDVPADQPAGSYTNITTPVTASVGEETVVGNPATDDLIVVAAPRLRKEFTDDPAQPGGTTTLQFTLSHDAQAVDAATGIAFTDDLDAALSGLVAVGLPQNDVCGAGSQVSGTSTLSLSGGTLAPGEDCAFSVTLQVPAVASVGSHTNTTSGVTATVAGVATAGNPATADLSIAGLVLAKEFTDDPAFPGGNVNLRFTIDNISPLEDATNISFQDELSGVLAGLTADGLPLNDVCGTGSSLTGLAGNTQLLLQGGSLAAGASCQFDVSLQVPAGAASSTYLNRTSGFSATMGGSPVPFPNASDQLVVLSERLAIGKEFTDDPVFPGDPVTLEFTITNLDAALSATDIAFSDDLDAALSGLAAAGLPLSDVCGAGSQVSGTGLLSLTGGSLGPGESCTFSVTVQVPAAVAVGTSITNTTSEVTGTMAAAAVTGPPASADLLLNYFTFSKAFDGVANPGGTATLSFTIQNLDGSAGAIGLSFTDDLDAVIPGMVATGLPAADICGVGSAISGSALLTFTGGELGPGESCTFEVGIQIPPATTAGSYDNTTSVLFQGGAPSGEPATASIDIEEAAAAAAIPATTPVGTLALIALLAMAAVGLLKWRM